jgi:hypothetical protein
MNERFEQCLYLSGLTAQGCWDELDDYAKQGIHKFAELIVRECLAQVDKVDEMLEDDSEKAGVAWVGYAIEKHFGVKE